MSPRLTEKFYLITLGFSMILGCHVRYKINKAGSLLIILSYLDNNLCFIKNFTE